MATYNNKIEGYQGNSKEVICFVEDASGIFNISDYVGYMYAKKFPVNPDAALDISVNYTSKDTDTGGFYFNLSTTVLDLDEGDYEYEIIIDDNSTNRFTVTKDRFTLLKSLY